MVGIANHAEANGVMPSAEQTELQSAAPLDPDHDEKILHDELTAAANYLQARISDPSLVETVTQAASEKDPLKATNALADAFLQALDASPDPDGPASLDGCMQELLVWLRKQCNMNSDLVDRLATGLCSGTSSPRLRLRCIALLYNSVDHRNHEKRFSLLVSTISLAASLNMVPNVVDTVLPKVDTFLKQWEVSLEDKRRIYSECYHALKSADMLDKAFNYNIKLLTLYNGASDADFATVHEETVNIIVDAVRLPKLYRFDTLLELDAVNRLENLSEGDSKLLYQLICIFVRDDLAVFRQFHEANRDLLAKYEIDPEVAENKMRLLTFASLGIESQDLTYAMIARALQISNDQVEHWVIKAISSGLVDAKINQLKSSVAIYRSTQRMFTREEWQPLSERINIWKENIGELLSSLQETRQVSSQAAGEAFSG